MNDSNELPQASSFMNPHVHVATPEMTLAEIIRLLLKHRISNSPVVEQKNGKQILVGFISERDCLAALANEAFFGNPCAPQTARTIMRRHPVCVSPDTELFALASIFVSHGLRHLPVVEGGELLGIVSRRDILEAMQAYYENVTKHHDQERFPPELPEMISRRFLVERS